MKNRRSLGICSDLVRTMISKTIMTQTIPSNWISVEKDKSNLMKSPSTTEINIIFRREVKGIASFVTYSFDVKTDWINDRLARYMAQVVREFYNLHEWETVCYYYSDR